MHYTVVVFFPPITLWLLPSHQQEHYLCMYGLGQWRSTLRANTLAFSRFVHIFEFGRCIELKIVKIACSGTLSIHIGEPCCRVETFPSFIRDLLCRSVSAGAYTAANPPCPGTSKMINLCYKALFPRKHLPFANSYLNNSWELLQQCFGVWACSGVLSVETFPGV